MDQIHSSTKNIWQPFSQNNTTELPKPSGYQEPQGIVGKFRAFSIKVKEDEYLRKKIATVCFLIFLFTWMGIYYDTSKWANSDAPPDDRN